MSRTSFNTFSLVGVALCALALCSLSATPCAAEQTVEEKYASPDGMSKEVGNEARVVDRRKAQLPLDTIFDDETGKQIRFGDLLGERPVLVQFVYFSCPGLCNAVLNGTLDALSSLQMEPGVDFDLITVSINPTETSNLARGKKENYLRALGKPEAAKGWHFLTGTEVQIKKLTEAAGFGYRFDEESREYAHGAALFVVTPEGVLSNTLYGAVYPERTVRLALVEAADGKIGSAFDQVLLFCYHYDPETGEYTATVMGLTRVFSLILVLWLGGLVGFYFWRERSGRLALEAEALEPGRILSDDRIDDAVLPESDTMTTAPTAEPANAGGTA